MKRILSVILIAAVFVIANAVMIFGGPGVPPPFPAPRSASIELPLEYIGE